MSRRFIRTGVHRYHWFISKESQGVEGQKSDRQVLWSRWFCWCHRRATIIAPHRAAGTLDKAKQQISSGTDLPDQMRYIPEVFFCFWRFWRQETQLFTIWDLSDLDRDRRLSQLGIWFWQMNHGGKRKKITIQKVFSKVSLIWNNIISFVLTDSMMFCLHMRQDDQRWLHVTTNQDIFLWYTEAEGICLCHDVSRTGGRVGTPGWKTLGP